MGEYNIGRRRALGESLGNTAQFFRVIGKRNIRHARKEVAEQWGLMNSKEEAYLEETERQLMEVVKRLKTLEARMLR